MSHPKHDKVEWLTLSEASKRLNVHPTTLRRWADDGKIPYMLTPGGHRRFASSDVVQVSARQAGRQLGPVERIWADHALERTREALSARRDDSWLQNHDEESRRKHREMGQQLMELTLNFLTAPDEDDGLVERAREIGRRYGQAAEEKGMPVAAALRVSMLFRDSLVTAAVELPDNMRIPAGSQARLLKRINKMLDSVQLGVVEVFGSE